MMQRNLLFTVVFLLVFLVFVIATDGSSGVLSRRKRYVAFPDGSTLIFALCMTAHTIMPFYIFVEGTNWGIAYNLPNRTSYTAAAPAFGGGLKHRHKREIYTNLEVMMNSMGFDGKACVYRALCEATRLTRKSSLPSEIMRRMFTYQTSFGPSTESPYHNQHNLGYQEAYEKGKKLRQHECAALFPACSISLVDLALGHYDHYAAVRDEDEE